MWGKLYRKSILDKASPHQTGLAMGEDLAFNLQIFPFLKHIYIIDAIGYNYRFGGITSKYNPNLLPDLKRLYCIKEQLIKKYNYEKASDFVRIELKNVLKSDVCQMISFNIGGKEYILNRIKTELNDPVYERMTMVKQHPDFHNDPFVRAVTRKDADMIYNICNAQVKKERPKRLLKKTISSLLMYI